MNDNILLSICIPTYNRVRYLMENLEQLLSQVQYYKDCIEVIISDNCSTDGTKDRVLSEISNCNLPVYFYQNEKNIGGNNNIAKVVDLSKGKYVYIMGDDDVIAPNFIQTIIGIIQGNVEISIIHWNRISVDENSMNGVIKDSYYKYPEWRGNAIDFVKIVLDTPNFISSLLFNRKCWELGESYIKTEEYLGYIWFARIYWGVVLHNKECIYLYFPLVVQRCAVKTWSNMWPRYFISSMSNIFYDLNDKISGIYYQWSKKMENNMPSTLWRIANDCAYYRRPDIKKLMYKHLTRWEKIKYNFYLIPGAAHLHLLKNRFKYIIRRMVK